MAWTIQKAGASFFALTLLFAGSHLSLFLLTASSRNEFEKRSDLQLDEPLSDSSPQPSSGVPRHRRQQDHLRPDAPPGRGRPPSNAFERHYLSVYRSMIIDRTAPPKFVLFEMNAFGFGNRIRTLGGAMFLAALTDRVLLVNSPVVGELFDPPELDGLVLDWNASLAHGACDDGNATVRLFNKVAYPEYLVDFRRKHEEKACVITRGSFGHDRLFLSLNEGDYLVKALRLFGGGGRGETNITQSGASLSRYIWTGKVLGLVLQRPSRIFLQAGSSALDRLPALRDVHPSRRIAIHLRTYQGESRKYNKEVAAKSRRIWSCVVRLMERRVAELRRGDATNKDVVVLLISDSAEAKKEGERRLSRIKGCRVVDAGLPVVHTGSAGKSSSSLDATLFAEWFLAGECQTLIASGHSSFGLTAFFRPSTTDPSTRVGMESKVLFTVQWSNVIKSLGNPSCGQVSPGGYGDINFGMGDVPLDPKWAATALAKHSSPTAAALQYTVKNK